MGYHRGSLVKARRICANMTFQRYKSTRLSANEIRHHFIDYFRSSGHSYIRSSPVRPFSDPTLEFVNAGMNQFKNIFLGLRPAPALSATNSQKCIRIGGKHNDLEVVGQDTYHHTFFEMLGNWSFNNYFKKEACELAWKLITSPPFSLPVDRLYVTYFGGDAGLSLSPDSETKDIWTDIGVPSDRILPFGMKDNFWEMGLSGPCGPCTEIHYDHKGNAPRPHCVNQDMANLTELWNIVFIEYNREERGTLKPLLKSYVDTGMGFERMVAVLQGKMSNYDTDLFIPLFNEIQKICKIREYKGKFGVEDADTLDTRYRILADHSRMVTVAISDNIFPYQSHGLRRVLRKALRIAESLLPGKGEEVMIRLSKAVAHSLGAAYPEVCNNTAQVEYVIRDEYRLWKHILSSTTKEWQAVVESDPKLNKLTDVLSPGLIRALKEIDMHGCRGKLPVDLALVCFDRYGLSVPLIEELSSIKGLNLDVGDLRLKIEDLKASNKKALGAASAKIPTQLAKSLRNLHPTDDTPKYTTLRSEDGKYAVPELDCKILAVVAEGRELQIGDELKDETRVGVICDKSNCWTSQKSDSDVGEIEIYDKQQNLIGRVTFDNVSRFGNHLVHSGTFKSSRATNEKFDAWDCKLKVDVDRRLKHMRNVTASHLLSLAFRRKLVGHLSYFSNSSTHFTMKFVVYDPNASEAGLILLEQSVIRLIRLDIPINVSMISLSEMLGGDDIFIPHVVNRQVDHLPMIEILKNNNAELIREVSYGPNLLKTGDVGDFCFADIIFNRKQREVTFKCITGPAVNSAFKAATTLIDDLRDLNADSPIKDLDEGLSKANSAVNNNLVPICFRVELNHLVNGIEKLQKSKLQESNSISMKKVIEVAKRKEQTYLVHYAGEDCKLEKLTKLASDLPVMLFAYNRGHLTARCCTPMGCPVDANAWMSKVAEELGTVPVSFKGHDERHVCGLKPLKMTRDRLSELSPKLEDLAKKAMIS